MKYTPRLPKSNVNVTPTSLLREFFVLTLYLLGIVISIYVLLGFAVDLIVPRISTDLETKMSELFIRYVNAEDIDSEWGGYAQSLVEDLQNRCPKRTMEDHILGIFSCGSFPAEFASLCPEPLIGFPPPSQEAWRRQL